MLYVKCGNMQNVKSGYTWPCIAYVHNTATDRRWARSHSTTPPVKKLAPLTTRSSCLRCVSAAEHHTVEQYPKTGRTKPLKHLQRSTLSWNIRQDFLKIPNRWEAALETERRFFRSKVIFESNVTPIITRFIKYNLLLIDSITNPLYDHMFYRLFTNVVIYYSITGRMLLLIYYGDDVMWLCGLAKWWM